MFVPTFRSANQDLLDAMNTLQQCLADPNCNIEARNRIKMVDKFKELKRLHSEDPHNCNNFEIKNRNESWLKMVTEMINIFESCSISHPRESSSTPVKELNSELLQALLCFFLLGEETATIKKRQLIYWWVGQGLIDIHDDNDVEKAANVMLNQLIEANAIEQVISRGWKKRCSQYKLMRKSYSNQHQQNVGVLKKQETFDKQSQAMIETLFNYDVSILNIPSDWLRKMRNLKVLHLGRWSNDREQYFEVENVEFLQGLKYLKQVRFICFKGMSRIMDLGNEICSLGYNLRVLDLKSCPNLEVLPKGIGKLKNLTHLDVSECYLLDRFPLGIISLTKLQVLEGFVIGDVDTTSSCKFKDLANHLGTTLRKLSIRTRKVTFPVEDDLKALAKFVKLLKLKVVWIRVCDSDEKEATLKTKDRLHSRALVKNLAMTFRGEHQEEIPRGLPKQLEKLEVQGIPQKAVKNLMLRNNERLESLKKLYIIGGEVFDLTDQGRIEWKVVETMQLKYLTKLHMNWRQFKNSFPNVNYLEMIHCPCLSFFPCDQNGIWRPAEYL